MLINCLHGYFILREDRAGEISEFASLFEGLEFVAKDDYFTFDALKAAPTLSLKGGTFLDASCTKSFEGNPWDVMFENKLVFDFTKNKVVPITSITRTVVFEAGANYYLSNGLVLPGSLTAEGKRVTDYAARYLFGTAKFKYSEVTIV